MNPRLSFDPSAVDCRVDRDAIHVIENTLGEVWDICLS